MSREVLTVGAEIILRIDELENEDRYFDGYAVVTTKQTIKLLIDNGQQCCESFGYFWSNDNPDDFIGAIVYRIRLTDSALERIDYPDDKPTFVYDGDIMFVSIDTDRGTLQFVAYNQHNGYYGHEAKVISEQLQHSRTL